MKKVLFATTALVGSAGIAAADVAIKGVAGMGVYGGAGNVGGTGTLQFFTDVDVTFTMSGETDGGLTFGASIDLDESDGSGTFGAGNTAGASPAFAPATQGGETIFVSGSFGTLTMGDTDGAFDWALQEVAIGGSLNDEHTAHNGYNGNSGLDGSLDGQVARYDYSFSGFSIAVSAEVPDAAAGNAVYGIGAKYTFSGISAGDVKVGVGYQGQGAVSIYGASIDASLSGGFRGILNYSRRDGGAPADDYNHYGIGLGYTMNAITVAANYGSYNYDNNTSASGYGVIANYDLGGGAVLQAGYSNDNTGTDDRYAFGLSMAF